MPKLTKKAANSDEMIQNAIKICSEEGLAGISDTIVIAAGLPIGSPLPLNTVRVHLVGNVLARSSSGGFANAEAVRASGRIVWADSAAKARDVIKADGGDILVCPSLSDEYTPILRIVRGVICEGVCHIHSSILGIINPNLVWLSGVTNASRKLESGLFVTIDSEALLVYEGAV